MASVLEVPVTEKPEEEVEEKSFEIEKDIRERGMHTSHNQCHCAWNASLPYMIANDAITIHENATGEIPTVLKPDILYRVIRPERGAEKEVTLSDLSLRRVWDLLRSEGVISPYSTELWYKLPRVIKADVSYAKELRSELYKAAKISLPSETLSRIGNIAQEILTSSQEREYVFSLTREFNRPAGFYGNGGSCYWERAGSYRKSMCSCKRAGISLMVVCKKETAENSLAELWKKPGSDWRRRIVARSLVIPVIFRKRDSSGGRSYTLSPDWEKEIISRFIVTNCYLTGNYHEVSCLASSPNVATTLAAFLTDALKGASLGKNAVMGSRHGSYLYMNEGQGNHLPIIHIGREVPKPEIRFDANPHFVASC